MRLPNAEKARVDLSKLRHYCLDSTHPRGRHKARVFAARLGIEAEHAEELRRALLDAARTSENAFASEEDGFGRRFVLDFDMSGPRGKAKIRSGWIIRAGEDLPRLTSCYVL